MTENVRELNQLTHVWHQNKLKGKCLRYQQGLSRCPVSCEAFTYCFYLHDGLVLCLSVQLRSVKSQFSVAQMMDESIWGMGGMLIERINRGFRRNPCLAASYSKHVMHWD